MTLNLAEIAQQILDEGFDVKNGSVSDFEDLPEGEYEAMLETAEWKTSDSGFEWLSLGYEIMSGEQQGKKFFGMISFHNEQFAARNMKLAFRAAGAVGVELTSEDFDQPEVTLVEAFQDGIGQEVDLELTNYTTKAGKKGQNFLVSEPQFD